MTRLIELLRANENNTLYVRCAGIDEFIVEFESEHGIKSWITAGATIEDALANLDQYLVKEGVRPENGE